MPHISIVIIRSSLPYDDSRLRITRNTVSYFHNTPTPLLKMKSLSSHFLYEIIMHWWRMKIFSLCESQRLRFAGLHLSEACEWIPRFYFGFPYSRKRICWYSLYKCWYASHTESISSAIIYLLCCSYSTFAILAISLYTHSDELWFLIYYNSRISHFRGLPDLPRFISMSAHFRPDLSSSASLHRAPKRRDLHYIFSHYFIYLPMPRRYDTRLPTCFIAAARRISLAHFISFPCRDKYFIHFTRLCASPIQLMLIDSSTSMLCSQVSGLK